MDYRDEFYSKSLSEFSDYFSEYEIVFLELIGLSKISDHSVNDLINLYSKYITNNDFVKILVKVFGDSGLLVNIRVNGEALLVHKINNKDVRSYPINVSDMLRCRLVNTEPFLEMTSLLFEDGVRYDKVSFDSIKTFGKITNNNLEFINLTITRANDIIF